MKALLLAVMVGVATLGAAPDQAGAKRIGGGGSAGMQRSVPPAASPGLPAKPAAAPAAAPATAGAAAAAAPKRSWMGPIAGLAAGLGIAALMGHLGLGAGFGNILMMMLLAAAAFFAIRFLMRRFGPQPGAMNPSGLQFAGAGAPVPATASGSGWGPQPSLPEPTAVAASPVSSAPALPSGFDAPGFERIAKMIFIRMQTANDGADLDDLRAFTTPEMFATIRLDLQDRAAPQQTDVVKVDAQVLDVATEVTAQVVSVRFHGLIRENRDAAAMPFDEVWHLVKPIDGSREWAIAGIQQTA